MSRLHVRVFELPKEGNRREEYEDAWAYDEETCRLAVADGASDAFESRLWARALVRSFVREPPPLEDRVRWEDMVRWLESSIEEWRARIDWERLPWYAEEKARRGAFSTLIGLTFAWPSSNAAQDAIFPGHWRALAIGDTCLFQVRGDAVIVRFPVEQAADFGTAPPLLSTRPDYNRRSLEALQTRSGECRPGDLFILATDALAAWFLEELEAGEQPWQRLEKLTPGRFTRMVEHLRWKGRMRNDDVTLMLGWVVGQRKEGILVGADAAQKATNCTPRRDRHVCN